MSNFCKLAESDPSKYAGRMGQPWKEDEVKQLLQSIKQKKSIEDIAGEHQRTVGAITAQQRKLAYDYYSNDNMPIDMIISFTGLTEDEIQQTITRYSAAKEKKQIKEEKPHKNVKEVPITQSTKAPFEWEQLDRSEIIMLLKDIQRKLDILLAKP